MKTFFYILLLCSLSSCGSGQENRKGETAEKPTFKMITVPTMLTDPAKRAEYVAKHYWDNFQFADTTYINLPEVTEQAFVDYIQVLAYADPATAEEAINITLTKAMAGDTLMFAKFTEMFEKYLYDPNSPMRNEDLYIPVMKAVIASPEVDQYSKIRPQHILDMAMKNRVGTKATDFTYTMESGMQGRLSAIKSPYTLLFFYNPDCLGCKEIKENILASPIMNSLTECNQLKVLALYSDEDLKLWRERLPEMPSKWIVGYDKGRVLSDNESYDLRAIPTLYLLDSNKQVLLKDANLDQVIEYLSNLKN